MHRSGGKGAHLVWDNDLARTASSACDQFEWRLIERAIPYRIGHRNLPNRTEVGPLARFLVPTPLLTPKLRDNPTTAEVQLSSR